MARSDAGFRVEQAHNGLQALERAFDLLPDAILTDLNIPGIDGYELTRRLKNDPRTRRIPVLAVTGYAPFTQDPVARRTRRLRRHPAQTLRFRTSSTRTLNDAHHRGPRPALGLTDMASVMIVEDDPDTREMLERFLELEGFEVRTAANGQLALERCMPTARRASSCSI